MSIQNIQKIHQVKVRQARHSLPGVRASQYRLNQNVHSALLAGILVAALAVLFTVSTVYRGRHLSEAKAPNNWAYTRAFSADFSPDQLQKVFRASYAAYQQYVKRDLHAKSLDALEHAFDNVRSDADLRQGLLQLISVAGDKYARLGSRQEYETMVALRQGKIIGTGLSFNGEEPPTPFEPPVKEVEGPAVAAGVKEGDVITKIDDFELAQIKDADYSIWEKLGQSLDEGLIGSSVTLTIKRGQDILVLDVKRAVLSDGEEAFKMMHGWSPRGSGGIPGVEILDVSNLYDEAVLPKIAAVLKKMTDDKEVGLVVDLSGIKGADGETALRLAAMLMDRGIIARRLQVTEDGAVEMVTWEVKDGKVLCHTQGPFVVGRDGKISKTAAAAEKTETLDWPCGLFKGEVVVVVGGDTAGGGEVIAAALKSLKERCCVVGSEMTAGKGIAQSFFPVGSDLMLAVSTGFYLQPDGKSIEDEGVEPNVQTPESVSPAAAGLMVMEKRLNIVPLPQLPPTK